MVNEVVGNLDPSLTGDRSVHLWSAVAGKVEQGVLVVGAQVQVGLGDDQLVVVGDTGGPNLARRGDDGALA